MKISLDFIGSRDRCPLAGDPVSGPALGRELAAAALLALRPVR